MGDLRKSAILALLAKPDCAKWINFTLQITQRRMNNHHAFEKISFSLFSSIVHNTAQWVEMLVYMFIPWGKVALNQLENHYDSNENECVFFCLPSCLFIPYLYTHTHKKKVSPFGNATLASMSWYLHVMLMLLCYQHHNKVTAECGNKKVTSLFIRANKMSK